MVVVIDAVTDALPTVGHNVSTSAIAITGFGFAVIETLLATVQLFESVTVRLYVPPGRFSIILRGGSDCSDR